VEVVVVAWTRDCVTGIGYWKCEVNSVRSERGSKSEQVKWSGERKRGEKRRATPKAFLLYFIMGMTNVQKCDPIYIYIYIYVCV